MTRRLSVLELWEIERLARSNRRSELIDFFAELPRHIIIPKAVLLGSNAGNDFLVEGYAVTSAIIEEMFFLDDEYFDFPFGQRITKTLSKRTERFDGAFWEARQVGMRLDPGKTCLASPLGNCTDQIIAAHSIQRSELKKLARPDGHVFGFLFGGKTDHRNFSWPEPVGINEATTFTGVCSHHDSSIFQPIETKDFNGTFDQLFYTTTDRSYSSTTDELIATENSR